jgi:recombination associated protein RdgC
MWFRNLQIYRVDVGNSIPCEEFDSRLRRHALRPCGGNEMKSLGWVPPTNGDKLLRVIGGRHFLIALGVESRLLPASVIKEEVARRAAKIAEQQGYKPGRNQLRELGEQVSQELLPRAFTRYGRVFVWIDPVDGWLGIDTASRARAEEVLEYLHKTFSHLSLALPRTARSPASAMADWLARDVPANFTVDQDCELRAHDEEKATVRYAHHPLDGGEIRDHLSAGKLPTRLALTFDDRVSFILTDKLELKRLDFLDVVRDELGREDDAEALFDAEFALMTAELRRLIPTLFDAMGGEQVQN